MRYLLAAVLMTGCGVGVSPEAPDYAESAQEVSAPDAGACEAGAIRCLSGHFEQCRDGAWAPIATGLKPPPECLTDAGN